MRRALVLALGAVLLGASGARAGDGPADPEERNRSLREEIRALETLRRVDPDLDQASWMLHAARILARDRDIFEARRAALLSEQDEAFRRFLEEDDRDRGFTPTVERAAALANRRMKDLEEDRERLVARLTEAVREALSESQRDAAEGRRLRRGSDPQKPPATADQVHGMLLRIRMLPETEFRRREGQLAAFALRSPGVRKDATREEVVEAMRQFRAAREEDLPALRERICTDLFPGVRAVELARQMAGLKRTEDEPPGNLGHLLASPVAVPALEGLVKRLAAGVRDAPATEGDDPGPAPSPDARRDRKEKGKEKVE